MPSPETEAQIEGAVNLWRYKGRAALAALGVVVGLLIFSHVDAASSPGPTSPAPAYHHVDTSGPDSNQAPPVFKP